MRPDLDADLVIATLGRPVAGLTARLALMGASDPAGHAKPYLELAIEVWRRFLTPPDRRRRAAS